MNSISNEYLKEYTTHTISEMLMSIAMEIIIIII